MIDYYQKRKYEERKLRKRKVVAFFLVFFVILLIISFAWLMHASVFQINDLSINIANNLSDDLIKDEIKKTYFKVLEDNFFSKLFQNKKNILIAKIYEPNIKNFIAQKFPKVENISIKTNLFKKSVLLDVFLRQYYGIWCFQKKSDLADSTSTQTSVSDCYWFDRQGVAFDYAPNTQGQLINKIIDLSSKPSIFLGNKILNQDEIENLIAIFDLMEKSGFSYKTFYIENNDLKEIYSSDFSKPVLKFSLRNNPSYALGFLKEHFEELKKVNYIDLRISNRIYYQ